MQQMTAVKLEGQDAVIALIAVNLESNAIESTATAT